MILEKAKFFLNKDTLTSSTQNNNKRNNLIETNRGGEFRSLLSFESQVSCRCNRHIRPWRKERKVIRKSVDLDLLWFGGWKKVTQTYSLLLNGGFFHGDLNPMVE